MAESPNPIIDLTKNTVRAVCPTGEDCSTAISVHESMRDVITEYQCRKHHVQLVIQET